MPHLRAGSGSGRSLGLVSSAEDRLPFLPNIVVGGCEELPGISHLIIKMGECSVLLTNYDVHAGP